MPTSSFARPFESPALVRSALVFATLGLAPAALSQRPVWDRTMQGASTDWGTRMTSPGDIDGDGVAEVVVIGTVDQVGRILSGRTGALLRTDTVGLLADGVGCAAIADIDGDGVRELAYATTGFVRIVDGRTGTHLRNEGYPGGPPTLGQVWIASLDDVDGDGVGDHVVSVARDWIDANGFPQEGGAGNVALHSGGFNNAVHFALPDATVFAFGGYCADLGDVTGDGKPDYFVGSGATGPLVQLIPGSGGAQIYSGSSGLAHYLVPRSRIGAGYSSRIARVGDIGGVEHYVLTNPHDASLRLLAGGTATPVVNLHLSAEAQDYFPEPRQTPEARQGSSIARVADVDGDGVEDVWIGSPMPRLPRPQGGFSILGPGQLELRSGATLDRIRTIVGSGWNEGFGTQIVPIGDANADGVPDLVVGAPEPVFGAGEVRCVGGGPVAATPYRTCVGSYRGPFGLTARIGSGGSVATAQQNFRVSLEFAEASNFALLQAAPELDHRVIVHGLAGPLTTCIGGPLVRVPGVVVTSPMGDVTRVVPVGPGTPFLAGTTWAFQWAFRSGFSPFELSDALVVTFAP